MIKHYDVVIVGGGIVGATTALLLAKNTALSIALIEAKSNFSPWKTGNDYDHRVSAISLASKHFFQKIQIWKKITEKRVSPYFDMHVWDAEDQAQIHFSHEELELPVLGYIIEDSVMKTSLYEEISEVNSIHVMTGLAVTALLTVNENVQLQLSDKTCIQAKLVIGADGANSRVRELMQVAMKTKDYQHTAIVATVKTELPHRKTAWQRFLLGGPLAFLPLLEANTSSIVWSVSHDTSSRLMGLNNDDFSADLAAAFFYQFGQVTELSERYAFPLRMRHVNQYVLPHLVLIGDAAHTIHPLAGQGVNMGLQDAAYLSSVIIEAVKKRREFYSFANLRRYERMRKNENAQMLAGVALLKQCFQNQHPWMKNARCFGMRSLDQLVVLKKILANHAVGKNYCNLLG